MQINEFLRLFIRTERKKDAISVMISLKSILNHRVGDAKREE